MVSYIFLLCNRTLNNLNNTSQVLVTDLKTDKVYKHDRDYEGNVKDKDFKQLNDDDQLVNFDKYIKESIKENGIVGTQSKLMVDVSKMNFKPVKDIESARNELKFIFEKDENSKTDNPFKNKKDTIEISVLTDSNNNRHATFKMENSKGVVLKTAEENEELFNNNAMEFENKLIDKKEQMEL